MLKFLPTGKNPEVFKATVANAYPNFKKGAILVYGGLLFRFVHEMKINDMVIYPSKIDPPDPQRMSGNIRGVRHSIEIN